jgi:hypothetical protein
MAASDDIVRPLSAGTYFRLGSGAVERTAAGYDRLLQYTGPPLRARWLFTLADLVFEQSIRRSTVRRFLSSRSPATT